MRFTEETHRSYRQNHWVPIFDLLSDLDVHWDLYTAMPLLRPNDELSSAAVMDTMDTMDFVTQTLVGHWALIEG